MNENKSLFTYFTVFCYFAHVTAHQVLLLFTPDQLFMLPEPNQVLLCTNPTKLLLPSPYLVLFRLDLTSYYCSNLLVWPKPNQASLLIKLNHRFIKKTNLVIVLPEPNP